MILHKLTCTKSRGKEGRGKVQARRQTEIMGYISYYNQLNSKTTLHEHMPTILGGREGKKPAIGARNMGDKARNRPGGHKVHVKEREITPAQRGQQQYPELAVLVVVQHRVAEVARSGSGSG